MQKILLLCALLLAATAPARAQTNYLSKPYLFAAELKPYDEKIAKLTEQLKSLRDRRGKAKPDTRRLTDLTRQIGEARRERRLKELELIQQQRGTKSGTARAVPRKSEAVEK